MKEKGMIQLLAPFIMAGVVIVLFYALYAISALLDWIAFDIFSLRWGIFGDLMNFFDLFDGHRSTGSWVVAGLIWLALTVWAEMAISEKD